MATINLGRVKPVFRGAYAGGTAYVVDDIVTSGNETFICIQASTGNATSNASYWTKLAAKGTDGTDGTDVGTTITTQGDILYRDGSGLARLAAGTSGQVLQTGGSGANPSWGTVSSDYVRLLTSDYSTAVNSVNLDNIFSSTYRAYKVILEDVRAAGGSHGELQLRYLNTSGNQIDGSYYIMNTGGQYHVGGSSAGQVSGSDNNRSSARLGNWNLSNANEPQPNLFELTFGQMHLNKEHAFTYTAKIFDANGNYDAALIGGVRYTQSTATRGINIQINGGINFSSYKMTVWGLK